MAGSLDVIICTHNRAEELKQTLISVLECKRPDEIEVRILVVANACTDDTVAIVKDMNLHVVEESRPGLAHARNRGLAETSGDAILWFDDDVSPDPDIFLAYVKAFQDYADAGFFGGPIRPVFAGPSPVWIEQAVRLIPSSWAGLDLGDPTSYWSRRGSDFLMVPTSCFGGRRYPADSTRNSGAIAQRSF